MAARPFPPAVLAAIDRLQAVEQELADRHECYVFRSVLWAAGDVAARANTHVTAPPGTAAGPLAIAHAMTAREIAGAVIRGGDGGWGDEPPRMPTTAQTVAALKTLTPEQRLDALSAFCRCCGTDQLPCHCANDE